MTRRMEMAFPIPRRPVGSMSDAGERHAVVMPVAAWRPWCVTCSEWVGDVTEEKRVAADKVNHHIAYVHNLTSAFVPISPEDVEDFGLPAGTVVVERVLLERPDGTPRRWNDE